jgi:Fe-S cluster assembly protein SufD
MSEHLEFYQKQAQSEVSTLPWLAELQRNAQSDFEALGFPTRYNEEWKYTSVDSFLKQAFNPAKQQTKQAPIDSDVPHGVKIDVLNGEVVGLEAAAKALPKGVLVLSLQDAIVQHADKVEPHLGRILKHDNGFQALNTAMLQSGLFIYIPSNVQFDSPLLINHWQDKSEQAVYLRHLIVAEEGSRGSIIEDYRGEEGCCYFTSSITEVFTAANAHVEHYKIQRESKSAFHVGHLVAKQMKHSQVDSHSFSIGGRLVRSDITVDFCEPHARCSMNGIYAPGDKQHVDHHTLVNHNVPDCESDEDYKGILSGHARAVFNGKVIVAKDAQHTKALQQNKNILLSANAEIDTKPQLEIFADDVVCTHGATVGQLDEEALFYLATRGIERQEASRYLIHAFAAENLQRVANSKLADWMRKRLTQHLG